MIVRAFSVLTAALAILILPHTTNAATFLTFVDNPSGFSAAIGSGSIVLTEDFSTAVNGNFIPDQGASPDVWNGFTVGMIGDGSGPSYGKSKYCSNLQGAGCITWNSNAPAVPGIYGSFGGFGLVNNGISIKPTANNVGGFSFDFTDWNDSGQRSQFQVLASDGTSTTVTGPVNPANYPPQTFGVTLSPADLAAGRYITEIQWLGTPSNAEVVGFYNFKTFTNPVISDSFKPVPSLSTLMLALLSMSLLVAMAWSFHRGARGGRKST